MKVRVCKQFGQYHIEYQKLWAWLIYQEDFGTVCFANKRDAIDCAKQLVCGHPDNEASSEIVWESE